MTDLQLEKRGVSQITSDIWQYTFYNTK